MNEISFSQLKLVMPELTEEQFVLLVEKTEAEIIAKHQQKEEEEKKQKEKERIRAEQASFLNKFGLLVNMKARNENITHFKWMGQTPSLETCLKQVNLD